jgi:hypothetical protein
MLTSCRLNVATFAFFNSLDRHGLLNGLPEGTCCRPRLVRGNLVTGIRASANLLQRSFEEYAAMFSEGVLRMVQLQQHEVI